MDFKVIFILLGLTVAASGFVNHDKSFSRAKVMEVERKIKHLRRHSLKTIQSEDGDIIDCIDIKKQPAFDHPALKDHKIQMAPIPTFDPTKETTTAGTRTKNKGTGDQSSLTVTSQVWQKSGKCPEYTIPVRRIRKEQLLKAQSIQDYGRKKPRFSRQVSQLNLSTSSSLLQPNRSVSTSLLSKAILFTVGYRYLGGKGDIKVDTPMVEADDEYSTSQVTLINGGYYDYELIEAGWAVNPSVYGDRQTRLFVYWTADGSKKTGCFDLTCPGFVHTNNEIALGAAIHPVSLPEGLTYQITIYIYKDVITNNWWMQYGDKNVGYWPPELFEAIRYQANSVEWGGEVFSSRVGHSPHTATAMGNGQFADIGGFSGYVKRMRIHDNSEALKIPEWASVFSDEYYCYNGIYVTDYVEDPEFYYGGPGRNPMCP